MPLQKLQIRPDKSGYSFKYGPSAKSTKLDGGSSRYRADYDGANTQIEVTWILKPNQYDYIMAFYRKGTGNGSLPFLIDLILEGHTITEYTAHIVPGTFGLANQDGDAYTVTASLEVEGNPPSAATDQATIDAYVP
jgi:hypothetical protein